MAKENKNKKPESLWRKHYSLSKASWGVFLVLFWFLKLPFTSFNFFFRAKETRRVRVILFTVLILAFLAGNLNYPRYWNQAADRLNLPNFWERPFKFGLDIQGGTHLVYQADLSRVDKSDRQEAMEGLRDVIERRVNKFGVNEPIVQAKRSGGDYWLVVDLAGVRDVKEAIKMIGETPLLEFQEERAAKDTREILDRQNKIIEKLKKGEGDQVDFSELNTEELLALNQNPYFQKTELTGKYLKRAGLAFDPNTSKPTIEIEFNSEGAKIFEEVTGRNIGKQLAIFLDGELRSAPNVNEAISGGRAVISGEFSIQEAKENVRYLNAGSLPVPIKILSQQSVEASLGEAALKKSLYAGFIAFLVVALFMILWYRLPGVLAVAALLIYAAFTLALFKLIPVTLTLAGIAGFVLSFGMAIDANILIFARMREEFRKGRTFSQSIEEGFKRAWTSIRDGNMTTLLTCFILYYLTTSVVRGFALTLGIGVLMSMFSAIFVTRMFLRVFVGTFAEKFEWIWYK